MSKKDNDIEECGFDTKRLEWDYYIAMEKQYYELLEKMRTENKEDRQYKKKYNELLEEMKQLKKEIKK